MFRLASRSLNKLTFCAGAAGVGIGSFMMANQLSADSVQLGTSLSPKEFRNFKIDSVQEYNHNCKLYKFKIEQQQEVPVASCLVVKALDGECLEDTGKDVIRPYTPIHQVDGELTLLVKTYPTGKMSKYLDGVKAGDIVQMKGPWTKKKYTANMKKELGMIAGGTGITPMLQVCKRILENPEDKTQVTLLYANVTEKDILLREELDAMAAQHENFTVKYVLEKPQASWRGLSGYINQTVLANHMPAPSADNMVFVCGPPGFMKAISGNKTPKKKQGELSGALKGLGFDETMVFKF